MSAIQNTKAVMDNPRSRLFVIIAIVGVIVLLSVGVMQWNRAPKVDPSAGANVPHTPGVRTVPGTSDSPMYRDLVETSNREEAERAHQLDQGGVGAHVPIITSNNVPAPPPVSSISPPPVAPGTTVVAPPRAPVPSVSTPPQPAPRPQDTAARDAAYKMAEKQVLGYMALWTPKAGSTEFDYQGKLPKDADGQVLQGQPSAGQIQAGQIQAGQIQPAAAQGYALGAGQQAQASQGYPPGAPGAAANAMAGGKASPGGSGPVYIRAGTIVPALLLTPIDSDAPGPVLAEITSGPFKGARLIGSYQATENQVVVAFRTLSMPGQAKSLSVDAFAVSADYRAGLATDVNHHYLKKFGLTAAAAFIQGYGEAIGRQNSTVVVGPFGSSTSYGRLSPSQINSAALGRVGEQLGTQLAQEATVRPTIKAEGQDGGSLPIGLLFMSDF